MLAFLHLRRIPVARDRKERRCLDWQYRGGAVVVAEFRHDAVGPVAVGVVVVAAAAAAVVVVEGEGDDDVGGDGVVAGR